MPHHSFDAIDPRYGGFIGSQQWSVCIGAGVSSKITPTWPDLTRAVFAQATGQRFDEAEFAQLVQQTGWGLDAWLQAGLNTMVVQNRSRDEFVSLIEEELYRDLLAKADSVGVRASLIRALGRPKGITVAAALDLHQFFEREFGQTSLLALARWLRKANRRKNAPRAVLTFNADGLLDLVLALIATHEHLSNPANSGFPKDEFRRVLRASDNGQNVTPIYHLHGCIVPRTLTRNLRGESRDNLIFPESGYSRLSSTVFTWQQTIFLSHAQSQRLVFVGLSMSDPNLRRWLSWCTANSVHEQEQRQLNPPGRGELIMGQHLWITHRPEEKEHEQALENSLLHLGTRIAWLDSWSQLPLALDNLLGGKP